MKKKIFSLLITICMCLSLLVGCNLFTINTNKFYSQIVATAGGYEFTMEQLLEAYDLYGSNYTDNGYSYEDAVKSSLDDMIEKTLLIEYIKENNLVTLTQEDYNDIKTSVYESIQSSITTYEEQIKTERGIASTEDEEETEETEETEENKNEFKDYTKKFVVDEEKLNSTGVFDIKRVVETDKDYGKDPGEFVQLIDIAYPDISEEAMNRYVKTLQSQARNYNRSDKVEDVKEYEYNRLTRILTENKYITKLQEEYENNLEIRKDLVVSSYVEQYLSDYVTYNKNLKLYNTTMSSNASSYSANIYYHPQVNYMAVTHILLKYDDVTSAKIKLLQQKLDDKDSGYTTEDYNADVLKLSESMEVSYTENGATKKAKASEIFKRIQNELDNCSTLIEKAEKFNELLYIFNQDDGIFNSEFGYLIPLDTSVEGASDSMIEEFANDARKLHEENKDGGNISKELVLGEYGYHIIFNLGEVKNLFTPEIMQNKEENFDYIWTTLFKTRVQLYLDKSWFDKIYDASVDESSLFNNYLTNLTNTAKSGIEIKKYESRYKSLWS